MALNRIPVYVFIFVLLIPAGMCAQPNYPVPTGIPNQLFYLQRTPNSNTIVCVLNLINGKLDDENPVHTFWVLYTDKGQKKELNFIQRNFAYGMKAKKLAADHYELHFVSYKKQKFYLQLGPDRQYHVYATINSRQAILNKVYLHINGGSLWSPNVEYIELTGLDPSTKQVVKERKKTIQ
jgi:Domain of unknown function (DUF4833)